MSYKVIYPKKLQILDSEGDCKLMGSLVHDWQHYGIITKNHTFEITLKKNFDQWLIVDGVISLAQDAVVAVWS